MSEITKIRPVECPKCSSGWETGRTNFGTVIVRCSNNDCDYPASEGVDREEAIRDWNERAFRYLEEHLEKKDISHILDSGNRTEFATGAVRDMREGKGRMDLMPLEVVHNLLGDDIFGYISGFLNSRDTTLLYDVLHSFSGKAYQSSLPTMLLEVGKHFEEGAKKYGENNWQKGIEPKYYIDSAIRHYLKWRRGDKDEPHDRAFVWNIMCCIWEVDWHGKNEEETNNG